MIHNPTLDLLLTRRTIASAFLGAPGPDEAALRTIIAAAIRVPDHGKLAPWRFIAIEGERRHDFAAFCLKRAEERDGAVAPEVADKIRTNFTSAPLTLVVVDRTRDHVKIPRYEQHLSVGASTMNAMIAAHALGFSAQWITGWMAFDEKVHRFLGLSEGETIASFLHIGTPGVPPSERPRPGVDDVLTRF